MGLKLIFLLICSLLVFEVKCARILGIFHIPAHSHQLLGTKLLYELAARGHEVTFITPTTKKEAKNVKIVQFDYPERKPEDKLNMFMMQFNMAISQVLFMDILGLKITEIFLNSTKIKEFLLAKQNFDVVIMENFLNAAFKGFCYHFNAHCITLSTVGANRWTNSQMGNPENPSYMPDLFVTYPNKMSFFQRFFNTIVSTGGTLFNHFYILPKQNEILQKHFPGAPNIQDLFYNSSLMLVNSHVSINAPVPLVPNMIAVGGFHIDPPKELPQDLQEYLDNAKDGAIYFSMGSNLQSIDMEKHKLDAVLKVFKRLKQKILLKWENDTLPETLTNVMTRSWFPQGDVLAHPNLKLFITHGGLLSTTESIYYGVPIIGIPICGDQAMNMAGAIQDEYGLQVTYPELSEETFGAVIDEVLKNPKYRENARKRSTIMHDEPVNPLERAVFWVEYVLRHNGAPHLRTSALNLKWYQYLILDVIAFGCLLVLIFLFVLYKVINIVIRKFTHSKSKKQKIN